MKGKQICKALKEIRLNIAQANDIDYIPAECNHKGDCSGTCPQCEKEMRYIEQQLLRLEQQALLLQWHRHIIMCQKLSKAKRN